MYACIYICTYDTRKKEERCDSQDTEVQKQEQMVSSTSSMITLNNNKTKINK